MLPMQKSQLQIICMKNTLLILTQNQQKRKEDTGKLHSNSEAINYVLNWTQK